jgi:hypothetical protein
VDGSSEFEETLGHAFAEAGAAAGDEDAFVLEKISAEHGSLAFRGRAAGSSPRFQPGSE